MIEVESLTKDYGTVVAVRDVSFSVGRGEVVGFLGPNGAGKSTTLRILAGFLGATRGRVRVNGYDLEEDSRAARRSLGYLPETSPAYPELRVSEYLMFRARLKEVPRRRRTEAIGRVLERARVRDVADTPIGHLSKGYRQRVGLADALLGDPPLLILDEPTAGLDPNQVREVRKLVAELAADHTVLLSTHILSEVEATCQRALVIDRGRLVAQGTLEELSRSRREERIRFELRDPLGGAAAVLGEVSGVAACSSTAHGDPSMTTLTVELTPDAESASIAEACCRALVTAGIGVRAVVPERPNLEQVFAELTREGVERSSAADEASPSRKARA